MTAKDARLVRLLLSIAFFILVSGCFSGHFIVYVWTGTVRLTSVNYANDSFIAVTLAVYFLMWALVGASLGLVANAKGGYLAWITSPFKSRKKLK